MEEKIEERLARIETDIKWIKENIREIRDNKKLEIKYIITILGSLITSITAILIAIIK